MQLTQLTEYQKSKIIPHRELWLDKILSDKPVNFDQAKEAIFNIFKFINKPKPKVIYLAKSPFACHVAGVLIYKRLHNNLQIDDSIDFEINKIIQSKKVKSIQSELKESNYNYRGGALWGS